MLKEFTINNYLTLRLKGNQTNIYVKGKFFRICKFLMFNIPVEDVQKFDEIQSIDEAADRLRWTNNGQKGIKYTIDPETEFWGHCSNLQAWADHGYDTRLLHSNLAFPLLKELVNVGDPIAKKVFKEEIAMRLESGYPNVIKYLVNRGYLDYLTFEELEPIIIPILDDIKNDNNKWFVAKTILNKIKDNNLLEIYFSEFLNVVKCKENDKDKQLAFVNLLNIIKGTNLLEPHFTEFLELIRSREKDENKQLAFVNLLNIIKGTNLLKVHFSEILEVVRSIEKDENKRFVFVRLLDMIKGTNLLEVHFSEILEVVRSIEKDENKRFALFILFNKITNSNQLEDLFSEILKVIKNTGDKWSKTFQFRDLSTEFIRHKINEFIKQFSVFAQFNYLDQTYIPEKLFCRDEVIKTLIFNYRKIVEKGAQPSINCLLLGKGGTGKTLIARYFGKNFITIALEKDVNLFVEYFNCITFRSKSRILREILAKYSLGSGKKYSDDETLKIILTQLIREEGYLLLIIDEVQLLKPEEVLALLAIAETFGHQNTRLSVLLISRIKDWMRIENTEILSRINQKITLKPYNFEESLKILEYRAKLAFKENILDPNIIAMIAQIVYDHKNMQHGIEILQKSGIYADKEGFERITADNIREASNEVYSTFRADIIDQLNDQELLVLYAITKLFQNTENSYVLVDDAYERYQTMCETYSVEPHVKMSFRKYLRNLNRMQVIHSRTVRIEKAERGRHNEISLLDISPDKLEELLFDIFFKKFS